jgi:hypothetical protein
MLRKILLSALLCLAFAFPLFGQSNVSLMRLVETNLVGGSGMIYLIVPAPLNGEAGQGEFFLVFYLGVVNPSSGIANHHHGLLAVERSGGVFTVVSSVPVRDKLTGNVFLLPPFFPDLSLGDVNLIFYRWRDVENFYRCFNDALGMLPKTLTEFQQLIGNNRDYQFTLLSLRDFSVLEQWQEFYQVGGGGEIVYVGMSENTPALLSCLIFGLSMVFGCCLFGSFISSLEKGVL